MGLLTWLMEHQAPAEIIDEASALMGTRRRGRRLPDDYDPSDEVVAYGKSKGLSEGEMLLALEEFEDYWHAIPGTKGCKLDWDRTFRNWLRQKVARKSRVVSYPTNGVRAWR